MSPEAKNYKQVSDTVKAEIQTTKRRVIYLFMEYITNHAKEKAFVVCFFFSSSYNEYIRKAYVNYTNKIFKSRIRYQQKAGICESKFNSILLFSLP